MSIKKKAVWVALVVIGIAFVAVFLGLIFATKVSGEAPLFLSREMRILENPLLSEAEQEFHLAWDIAMAIFQMEIILAGRGCKEAIVYWEPKEGDESAFNLVVVCVKQISPKRKEAKK